MIQCDTRIRLLEEEIQDTFWFILHHRLHRTGPFERLIQAVEWLRRVHGDLCREGKVTRLSAGRYIWEYREQRVEIARAAAIQEEALPA